MMEIGIIIAMQKRNQAMVYVTRKQSESIKNGHPWIYGDEIIRIDGDYTNGDIVDVVSTKGTYLGCGLINDHSKIKVRLFSTNASDTYDHAYWCRVVDHALQYRLDVMEDLDNARLVFGESDFLPGVTIDKFNTVLVAEIMCYGMEMRKDMIYNHVVETLENHGYTIDGLYERNKGILRIKEGLEEYEGWYPLMGKPSCNMVETIITENGIQYYVDIVNGQKTGFFLDQKYNRQAIGSLCHGKTILDCFTHTGSFGLNALKHGANHVTFVDISASAMEMTKRNVTLNHYENHCDFIVSDCFDYLDQLKRSGQHPYDVIILDPPAFTKSRSTIDHAMKGYQRINGDAMRILKRGGYLATASCSHFAYSDLFDSMIYRAAKESGTRLREIEKRKQSKDHPILMGVPETEYLKFHIYQKV